MATTERSPKYNQAYVNNGPITTLRTNIQAGNTVTYSDISTLAGMMYNWLGHYHTYDDAYQLATYGNNGDRNNYYEDKSSGSVNNGTSTSNWPSAQTGKFPSGIGATITAEYHNAMKADTAALASHSHQIDDRTG